MLGRERRRTVGRSRASATQEVRGGAACTAGWSRPARTDSLRVSSRGTVLDHPRFERSRGLVGTPRTSFRLEARQFVAAVLIVLALLAVLVGLVAFFVPRAILLPAASADAHPSGRRPQLVEQVDFIERIDRSAPTSAARARADCIRSACDW